MAVELSIIIVNWNSGRLLARCCESIAQAPPTADYEVIVIDNASRDDSLGSLRSIDMRLGSRLRIVENVENLGFSRANNQAIALSQAPLLLLLNPDTEVTPGAIDRMIATLRSDSRIGACGPRLLGADRVTQTSVWRSPPAAWEILLTGSGLYRLLPRRLRGELLLGLHWEHDRRRNVPMLSGAALLARRVMIDQVGGLDESYHMYGEDNEWCHRMARGGWRLVFEPEAAIVHHGGQSSLQRWSSLEKVRVQVEASIAFQRSCLSKWQFRSNMLAYYLVYRLRQVRRHWQRMPAEDLAIELEAYRKQIHTEAR